MCNVILPGDVPCIWMGAGLISFRLCDRAFDCENCPVCHPPCDRSYHRGHTWVRLEADGAARMGIDAFAAALLGRVRGVVAPHPGTVLRRGRPCAWIDETGGTLTLWAPISGRLLEINPALESSPEATVSDPYARGWILRVAPAGWSAEQRYLDGAEACAARTRRDAAAWASRVRRHLNHSDPKIGRVLQDGGEPVRTLDQLLGPTLRHALAAPYFERGRTAR